MQACVEIRVIFKSKFHGLRCLNMGSDRIIKNHLTEAAAKVDDWNYSGIWSCSEHFMGI